MKARGSFDIGPFRFFVSKAGLRVGTTVGDTNVSHKVISTVAKKKKVGIIGITDSKRTK